MGVLAPHPPAKCMDTRRGTRSMASPKLQRADRRDFLYTVCGGSRVGVAAGRLRRPPAPACAAAHDRLGPYRVSRLIAARIRSPAIPTWATSGPGNEGVFYAGANSALLRATASGGDQHAPVLDGLQGHRGLPQAARAGLEAATDLAAPRLEGIKPMLAANRPFAVAHHGGVTDSCSARATPAGYTTSSRRRTTRGCSRACRRTIPTASSGSPTRAGRSISL